jgi:hypothetical protein
MAASGSGNMNSSRAGIAEAVANRAYDDRRADVTTNIQDSLIDRSLGQQARQFADQGAALQGAGQANESVQSAYNMGMNSMGQGANFGMNAGNSLQGYNQAQLNDQKTQFEAQRDFELEQRKLYQSGMLGKAVSSPSVQPNLNNPYTAAVGGAMNGFGFASDYMANRPAPVQQQPMFNYNKPTQNPHSR